MSQHFKTPLLLLLAALLSPGLSGQNTSGNPLPHFLFPEFHEGTVIMKDGSGFSTSLNYNMLEERMITELNGIYRYSKDPKLIDTVYLQGKTFVPVDELFYEILVTGPVSLLLQNKCSFVSGGNDIGYGVKSQSTGPTQHSRFELSTRYGEVAYMDIPLNGEIVPALVYWIRSGNIFEKFTTQKQFLKIFPDYETQLKEFIVNEHITFKSREDLIKLVNYCNVIMGRK